ncbi:Translation elongation factor Ts [hydrothermal vent metagenome]|uniref:Translation elongation factor Ts n=1 Tax=hydrothermal vent metagenome TaxID=652676 RepID=A0A3B0Z369_9ZZZZ
MSITAAMVKELRERTGSGMMECKKALVETSGDIEQAIENMRKSGMAKADKKAGRVAAEGLIGVQANADNSVVAMVEVNSETDFVAKNEDFLAFTRNVAELTLNNDIADAEALLAATMGDSTVDNVRRALIATIGENISVRRVAKVSAPVVGAYQHGTRIAVLVGLSGGSIELARDIAMHIAASKPVCIDESGVDASVIEKEKAIFTAQAQESGKPAEIIEKMIGGRINKFLKEITLVGQPFVKNPDQTVAQLLKEAGATVSSFTRFEVGEGIEKEEMDFAAEVMAQAKGA